MWLHPINSYKYMSALEMTVVEDMVTSDLIADKYATKNPTHISGLRELFASHAIVVPKLNDSVTQMRPKCMDLANSIGLVYEPAYAFLNKQQQQQTGAANASEHDGIVNGVPVYVCAVDHPGRFYVQVCEFQKQLDNLNSEIQTYVTRMEAEKSKGSEKKSP